MGAQGSKGLGFQGFLPGFFALKIQGFGARAARGQRFRSLYNWGFWGFRVYRV